MPTKFSCNGQLHYCRLITALVDDKAIAEGIIAPKNVTQVLFYFIRLAEQEEFIRWITDQNGNLKERQWLQVLNYLINEEIFMANKKSLIVDYLIRHRELSRFKTSKDVQDAMWRPMKALIISCLRESFKKLSLP